MQSLCINLFLYYSIIKDTTKKLENKAGQGGSILPTGNQCSPLFALNSDGVIPYFFLKHLLKYLGSLKPVI